MLNPGTPINIMLPKLYIVIVLFPIIENHLVILKPETWNQYTPFNLNEKWYKHWEIL